MPRHTMKMSSRNTSGTTGVYKQNGKWIARIYHDKKLINLGTYERKINAEIARWEAEKKYGYAPEHGKVDLSYEE